MEHIASVPISLIDIPQDRLTSELSQDEFNDLCNSIREWGLLQPITLAPNGNRFTLVAGHNRLQAYISLKHSQIQAIIIDANQDTIPFANYLENSFRGKVNPIDEAIFLANLRDHKAIPMEQLCQMTSRSKEFINSRISLLILPADLRDAIQESTIPVSVAKELAEVDNPDVQAILLERAITEGASAKKVHEWRAGLTINIPSARPVTNSLITQKEAHEASKTVLECFACSGDYDPVEMQAVLLCRGCREQLTPPPGQNQPG